MTSMDQGLGEKRDSMLVNVVALGLICLLWSYDSARTLARRVVGSRPLIAKH